jgi:cyclin-dependent kinase-like
MIRKNIQREVRMLRLLKSEYVVELKEAFKRKGRIYLVFEHLDKNLLNLLEDHPNGLEPELTRAIIYQLVRALHFMHLNGVLHRDIKP